MVHRSPRFLAGVRGAAEETTSSRSHTSLRTRQASGELATFLQTSACAGSFLLAVSHTRVHSSPELIKFRTPLLGDSRPCGIPSALYCARSLHWSRAPQAQIFPCSVIPACAGSLRVPLMRALVSGVRCEFVSSVRFWTPSHREIRLYGPWSLPRGLRHPLQSNRSPNGDSLACIS